MSYIVDLLLGGVIDYITNDILRPPSLIYENQSKKQTR